jgi:gas vesicle protein
LFYNLIRILFLIGAAVGSGIALLINPQSRKRTPNQLKRMTEDAGENAEGWDKGQSVRTGREGPRLLRRGKANGGIYKVNRSDDAIEAYFQAQRFDTELANTLFDQYCTIIITIRIRLNDGECCQGRYL